MNHVLISATGTPLEIDSDQETVRSLKRKIAEKEGYEKKDISEDVDLDKNVLIHIPEIAPGSLESLYFQHDGDGDELIINALNIEDFEKTYSIYVGRCEVDEDRHAARFKILGGDNVPPLFEIGLNSLGGGVNFGVGGPAYSNQNRYVHKM